MKTVNRAGLRGLLALALIVVASAVLSAKVYAALSSETANADNTLAAGNVAITDNDSGEAMLSLSSAPLGSSDTSCINVSYQGSVPAQVRHHATVTGGLAPHLGLKVTRGTGANAFDNCSNFTADPTNYFGKGAGVIYNGKLSDYPTSWAAGILDPASGDSYSSTVGGTPGLVGYWRLGDGAVSADEFEDSAGTVLSSHTDSLAGTWTSSAGQERTAVVTNENRLRKETGAGAAQYYTSATPSNANYAVEADVHVKSLLTGGTPDSGDAAGILGRMDIGNTNGLGTNYLARYHVGYGEWQLRRHVDGVATALGSYAQTLTPGQTYRLSLEMNGSTIRLLVDGVQRISVTDTAISAAGRGGVRFGQANSTPQPTDTSGLHLDNFRITSLTSAAADANGPHTGTYSSGVRLNQPGALSGDADRAGLFTGTASRVVVPNQPSLQLSGNFSIETWIKPDVVTGTRYVLHKDSFYYLYLIGTDVVFGFRSGGVYKYVIASGAATAGSWQHFVGAYRGGMLSLYRNGVQVASAAQSGAVDTGTSNLFIGAFSDAGSFFQGTIDDIALYNVGLTEKQVWNHYAAAVGEIWTNPESHAYKFQITLDNDAAAIGKTATATFNWEARNL